MTIPIITILTDFGHADGYVGAMKGVMLSIVPESHLIDISHAVQPQNVPHAARILSQTFQHYPPHAVHLIVVDPGVGSQRHPIAVESSAGRFVAPDNGVLTPVLEADPNAQAVRLSNPDYWRTDRPSHTFHGRDIFSPAAAHLAKGLPLSELGDPLPKPKHIPLPRLRVTENSIHAEITHIDHFGNAVTNIAPLVWEDKEHILLHHEGEVIRLPTQNVQITCNWHTFNRIHTQYSTVDVGKPLVLVGSTGELEFAINQGSAAEQLSLSAGDRVTLHFN